MKANELRIGNWINRLGKPTFINAIQKGESIDYIRTPLSGAITINQIEPIPLTEEILLKCGFVNGWNGNYFCNTNGEFYFNGNSYEGETLSKNIKYLHQLQNLYFALTNQELIFNYGN